MDLHYSQRAVILFLDIFIMKTFKQTEYYSKPIYTPSFPSNNKKFATLVSLSLPSILFIFLKLVLEISSFYPYILLYEFVQTWTFLI